MDATPPRSGRPRPFHRRFPRRIEKHCTPRLEPLEARALLAVSFAEYPVPAINSTLRQITAGTDGSLWFTDPGTNQVGKVNATTGAITEFPIPTLQSAPFGITAAPDGNVWFTEKNANKIGKVDPATGTITEYAITTEASAPHDITFGADGNVWFTETSANQLGQMNLTTHVITEFPATMPNGPSNLIIGPDGKLWFTDVASSEIGSFDTSTDAVQTYPLTGYNSLTTIAAGSDGKIWFTDTSSPWHIGSLDPSSGLIDTIVGFPTPSVGGMTGGPNGQLWLTDRSANQIITIDPSSRGWAEYHIPFPAPSLSAITEGPDGNVWFIGNAIGKVNLSSTPSSTITSVGTASADDMATVGQPVTLTADVTIYGSNFPTGTVTFTINGQAQPPVPLQVTQYQTTAELTTSSLLPGANTISASYNGDANYAPSSSGSLTVQNNASPPSAYDVRTYALPQTTAPPGSLILGSDGNLWLTENNQIERLDPATGSVTQVIVPFTNAVIPSITAGPDNGLWFTDSSNNKVGKLDPKTGAITGYAVPKADGAPDQIVADPNGHLYFTLPTLGAFGELDPRTGKVIVHRVGWSSIGTVRLTVAPNGTIWRSSNGNSALTRFNVDNSDVDFPVPDNVAGVYDVAAGLDGRIWFTSTSNQIGVLTPKTRAVTVYSVPPLSADQDLPRVRAIVTAPDGNLWFTEASGAIGEINAATGSIRLFAVPSYAGFSSRIAIGPDAKIWFIGDPANEVWKFDPETSQATVYPVTTMTGNASIATAPDGNVWFVSAGLVGKYNPSLGLIVASPLGAPTSGSGAITLGPDGNLWFTALNENEIGKIDPTTGAVTRYPFANAGPVGAIAITSGPGGDLWFTASNMIGRLDPLTGAVTKYPISAPIDVIPGGIAAGADGNVWFTSPGLNQVERLDPSTGTITAYTIPTIHSVPGAIIAGPNGKLWFLETDVHQLGEIDPVTGAVTEIRLPIGVMTGAEFLASAYYGEVWVSDPPDDALVSFNADATNVNLYMLYPIVSGPAATGVGAIAVGPDQNPWFVVNGALGEVVLHDTTTVVTPPAVAAVAGESIAFTAVVSTFGDQFPTGSVTFFVDGVESASAPIQIVNGQSQATVTVKLPTEGNHTVTAHYRGNPLFVGSTSAPTTVTALTGTAAAGPAVMFQTRATDYPGYRITWDNGTPGHAQAFGIPDPVSEFYYRIYDATDPSNPVLLAGPVQANAGDYPIIDDSHVLADGWHTIAYTTALTADGPQGPLSAGTVVIVDTGLRVLSVSPADKSLFVSGLPGDRITITLSQRLAGLNYYNLVNAFANIPFAISVVPRGPDGTFASPSGGSPIPATVSYQSHFNGTSTITIAPQVPLGTDIYRVAISSSLVDFLGNHLAGNSPSGNYYTTFELRPKPATSAPPKVVSVTTQHASVNIGNNTIPQPDTIAIGFNKPLDFLTVNAQTVQLLAGPSNTPVKAAVTYGPTTNSIYLTPEAVLVPGTAYTVRVSGSITDDQGFPTPGYPLGRTFTTTFKVAPSTLTREPGPLHVLTTPSGHLAISPGSGVRKVPFGYVSIAFSGPIAVSSLGQASVVLKLKAGGLNPNAFDRGDPPLNARLAFNPNTDQLILVPTVPTDNGDYMLSLTQIKGKDGTLLRGPGAWLWTVERARFIRRDVPSRFVAPASR